MRELGTVRDEDTNEAGNEGTCTYQLEAAFA